MKEGLKCAAVFIGTVIGAGFATGQEVAFYFAKSSPSVAILAGILLGVACAFFMYVGSLIGGADYSGFLLGKFKIAYNVIMFSCAFITFISMFSGVETLFASLFNIKIIAVPTVIIAAIIAAKGLKWLKNLNTLIVPLILVFTAIIFFRNGNFILGGSLNPLPAIAYAALNIMLAGAVMIRLGKSCSVKTIKVAGIVSGVVFATLLYMIKLTVVGRADSMPMFDAAKAVGLSSVSGVLIFAAIFTTMVSALELSADCFRAIVPDKRLAVLTVSLMAYPFTIFISFENVVKYLYPIVSFFGVLLIILTVVKFVELKTLDRHRQKIP